MVILGVELRLFEVFCNAITAFSLLALAWREFHRSDREGK